MRKTFRDRLWKMWRWPVRNALLSHYERPWKPQIKYDEIPF